MFIELMLHQLMSLILLGHFDWKYNIYIHVAWFLLSIIIIIIIIHLAIIIFNKIISFMSLHLTLFQSFYGFFLNIKFIFFSCIYIQTHVAWSLLSII